MTDGDQSSCHHLLMNDALCLFKRTALNWTVCGCDQDIRLLLASMQCMGNWYYRPAGATAILLLQVLWIIELTGKYPGRARMRILFLIPASALDSVCQRDLKGLAWDYLSPGLFSNVDIEFEFLPRLKIFTLDAVPAMQVGYADAVAAGDARQWITAPYGIVYGLDGLRRFAFAQRCIRWTVIGPHHQFLSLA